MKQLFQNNQIRGLKFSIPLLFAAMLILSACVDEQITPPNNEKTIRFSLNVPGGFTPQTYAIPDGNTGDAKVETVDVLLFDSSGKYFSGPHYGSVGTTTGQDNSVDVTLRIPEDAENFVMGVFANSRSFLNSVAFSTDDDKATTLNKIIVSKNNGVGWNATPGSQGYLHIPMYGELATYSSGAQVKLHRMLARINVTNTYGGMPTFDFRHVYLANYNTSGCVAYTSVSENVPVLNVPASATKGTTAITYPVTNNTCLNEIFSFEVAAGDATSIDTNPCIILGGYYNPANPATPTADEYYYYRVDFAKTDGTYLPISRNHSYSVEISKIDGPGYSDIADAINSKPVNVKYTVSAWDESKIIDAAYNGQYMIGVSAAKFSFDAAARDENNGDNILAIQTNHPDGWSYEVIDADGTNPATWLTLIKPDGSPITTPVTDTSSEVKLKLEGNTGGTEPQRSAVIKLTAGNVVYSINVVQSNQETIYDVFQPEAEEYIMATGGHKILIPVSSANADPAKGIQLGISDSYTVELSDPSGALRKVDALGVGYNSHVYVESGSTPGTATVTIKKGTQPLCSWEIKTVRLEPESNSYIVAPGDAILIPVSRANADPTYNGTPLDAITPFTSGLVWMENYSNVTTDGLDATSNLETIKSVGKGSGGYVYVKTGTTAGNAVVSIKNTDGDILWSWHIWVTTDVPSVNGFMDRNLGALNNGNPVPDNPIGFTVTPDTYGLYYQWGRKDPFPRNNGTSPTSTTNRTVYYGSGSTGTSEASATLRTSGTSGRQSIQYSVQNPDRFVIVGTGASDGQEWSTQLNDANSNRWEYLNFQSKSVYDPCPPGWRVPIDGIWPAQAYGWLNTVTTNAQRNDGYGGIYPAQGRRTGTSSGAPLASVGSVVYGWSATPSAATISYQLYASGTTLTPSYNNSTNGRRSHGASVRCIQEPDGPIVVYNLADSYLFDGSTYSFSLYSDTPYSITYSQSDIVSMTNSSGNAGATAITFTTQALGGNDRPISFTITNGSASKTVSFMGDMPDPFLNATNLLNYYRLNGTSSTINFNTNTPWKIKSVTETITNGSTGTSLISNDADIRSLNGNAGQGQSITVTADAAAASGGVVTIVFSTSDGSTDIGTLTLPFAGTLTSSAASSTLVWAGSNIYYDSSTGKLTFDDTDQSNSVVNDVEKKQGLYFKWGSLYGISPSLTGTDTGFSATDTKIYTPSGRETTAFAEGFLDWASIPYIASTDLNVTATADSYLYYRTDDVSDPANAARGDICRWISLNNWGPAGQTSGWRMPTYDEFLTANTTNYPNAGSAWTNITSADVSGGGEKECADKAENNRGQKTINSGRTNDNNATYKPFFPAAGYRNTNGTLSIVGSSGYYWSSSPSTTSGRYLGFSSSGASMNASSRLGGFSVRCVRE